MKMNDIPMSSLEVIEQLRTMPSRSPRELALLQMATAYLEALLPRGKVLPDGRIQFSVDESRADTCPVCGYRDMDRDWADDEDDRILYSWECPKCGCRGQQCHTHVFHHHLVTELTEEGRKLLRLENERR